MHQPGFSRSRQSADTRILDLAMTQLRQHGVAGTSIISIASQAGMSHANVYRHFASKAALVDAAMAHWLKPLEASLRVIADGPDPASDKLERMLFVICRNYQERMHAEPNLFAILTASITKGSAMARRHRGKIQSEIQRVLDEGASSGSFDIADMRAALALVFDALHRFIHPVCLHLDRDIDRDWLTQRAEQATRLVLRTLVSGRM